MGTAGYNRSLFIFVSFYWSPFYMLLNIWCNSLLGLILEAKVFIEISYKLTIFLWKLKCIKRNCAKFDNFKYIKRSYVYKLHKVQFYLKKKKACTLRDTFKFYLWLIIYSCILIFNYHLWFIACTLISSLIVEIKSVVTIADISWLT